MDDRSTSELLESIRERNDAERITIGEILDETENRAHGLILVVLALPETVPMIGLSALLALPIFLTGFLMLCFGGSARLPDWIRRRSMPRETARRAINRALPVLRWMDRVSRPRWAVLARAARVQGAVCVVLAVVLAVPIPGVNLLAAFGVAGIGVGMLQRDGVVVAAGLFSALLALGGAAAVVTGALSLVQDIAIR